MGLVSAAHAQSSLAIDVKLSPAGTFRAETNKITGNAYKTADGVRADNVVIDMRSLKTGISLRDKHLKDHLEVTKYPTAKLIKALGRNGLGTAIIEIKGQKQEVKGTYRLNGNSLQAKFIMKLSALRITGVRYMTVGVADDVSVTINLPVKPR